MFRFGQFCLSMLGSFFLRTGYCSENENLVILDHGFIVNPRTKVCYGVIR